MNATRTALENEYTRLYARRGKLQAALDAVLTGAKSATLSTAGNSQSFTAQDAATIRAEIRAITARLRQLLALLGGPSVPFCGLKTSAPDFGA